MAQVSWFCITIISCLKTQVKKYTHINKCNPETNLKQKCSQTKQRQAGRQVTITTKKNTKWKLPIDECSLSRLILLFYELSSNSFDFASGFNYCYCCCFLLKYAQVLFRIYFCRIRYTNCQPSSSANYVLYFILLLFLHFGFCCCVVLCCVALCISTNIHLLVPLFGCYVR